MLSKVAFSESSCIVIFSKKNIVYLKSALSVPAHAAVDSTPQLELSRIPLGHAKCQQQAPNPLPPLLLPSPWRRLLLPPPPSPRAGRTACSCTGASWRTRWSAPSSSASRPPPRRSSPTSTHARSPLSRSHPRRLSIPSPQLITPL